MHRGGHRLFLLSVVAELTLSVHIICHVLGTKQFYLFLGRIFVRHIGVQLRQSVALMQWCTAFETAVLQYPQLLCVTINFFEKYRCLTSSSNILDAKRVHSLSKEPLIVHVFASFQIVTCCGLDGFLLSKTMMTRARRVMTDDNRCKRGPKVICSILSPRTWARYSTGAGASAAQLTSCLVGECARRIKYTWISDVRGGHRTIRFWWVVARGDL